jgi:hypothetical protein
MSGFGVRASIESQLVPIGSKSDSDLRLFPGPYLELDWNLGSNPPLNGSHDEARTRDDIERDTEGADCWEEDFGNRKAPWTIDRGT